MNTETFGLSAPDFAREVNIVVQTEMTCAPYWFPEKTPPDKRLPQALDLVLAGKVTATPGGEMFQVQGSTQVYTITGTCTCPQGTKGHTSWCKHRCAVELYKRVSRRLGHPAQPSLALPPTTVDERIAQTPAMTPVDEMPYTLHPSPLLTHPGAVEEPDVIDMAETYDPEAPDMAEEPRMATTTTPAALLMPEPEEVTRTGGYCPRCAALAALLMPEPEEVTRPALPTVCTSVAPLTVPRRGIQAIIADLSKPLPSGCVAEKTQGGNKIRFLHWQTVARLLDTYAPGWHGYVVRVDRVGKQVAITYRLTIPCVEGEVSREATGQEDEEVKGYGDSTSNGEAMAFKRAAAKFGLGAWLYDKDATADALAKHLRAEKVLLLDALGKACDALGKDRKQVIAWLRSQTSATKNLHIPTSAIQAALSQLDYTGV